MHESELGSRLLPTLQLQGLLPVSAMQSAADAPVRRPPHERGSAGSSAPAIRVHGTKGAAAGKPVLTGIITAHQTCGDQLRWNPHFHGLVLEGGCDEAGAFVSIPFSGLQAMTEVFRRQVIWLLVEKELLSEEFARNLLSWKNSGFSIDNSVRVTDVRTQESLAQYISRPPVSLKKIRYEPFKGRVLFHTTCSEYFGEEVTVNARKRAWARLLAKVYEIDPLVCPKCGGEMKVIAVIQDPAEIRDIPAHLVRTGRAPPGFDQALLN